MDVNPGGGIIQGKFKNGYNEIMREEALNSIRDTGRLDDTLVFIHALMHPKAYVSMGSGTHLHSSVQKGSTKE